MFGRVVSLPKAFLLILKNSRQEFVPNARRVTGSLWVRNWK